MLSKQQTGLTMIEILVVLAIAAILAAVATPSLSTMIQRMRQSSTMSQLATDVNRARVEAIKRNIRVLVCMRSTDSLCGASTSWNNGWLVCSDADGDGQCDANSAINPNPIVVRKAINTNLNLLGSASFIRFNPNGTQGAAGAGQVNLTLGGNWTGSASSVANISPTGNLSKSP
jgi:type IV fimbrial biogenesis protein FimT